MHRRVPTRSPPSAPSDIYWPRRPLTQPNTHQHGGNNDGVQVEKGGLELAKTLANAAPEPLPPPALASLSSSGVTLAGPTLTGGAASAAGASSLKRRLWLRIARHVASTVGAADPQRALRVLDECPT